MKNNYSFLSTNRFIRVKTQEQKVNNADKFLVSSLNNSTHYLISFPIIEGQKGGGCAIHINSLKAIFFKSLNLFEILERIKF